MKKALIFLAFVLATLGCGENDKGDVEPVTLSAKIGFNWITASVLEDGTQVYSQGSSQNIKTYYGTFTLDLSNPPKVVLTEIDGLVFTGTFSVNETTKELILSALSPQPFSTNGKIVYSIESLDGNTLVVIRSEENPKTGTVLTKYILKKS